MDTPGISVRPIEMPGHSVAALAAYPEFSCRGEPVITSYSIHYTKLYEIEEFLK